MKVVLIKNSTTIVRKCNSFEFRTNKITNWIVLKYNNKTECIYDIVTIKVTE